MKYKCLKLQFLSYSEITFFKNVEFYFDTKQHLVFPVSSLNKELFVMFPNGGEAKRSMGNLNDLFI